jgi:hypothetical protein
MCEVPLYHSTGRNAKRRRQRRRRFDQCRFYQLRPDNSCYRTYQFRAENLSRLDVLSQYWAKRKEEEAVEEKVENSTSVCCPRTQRLCVAHELNLHVLSQYWAKRKEEEAVEVEEVAAEPHAVQVNPQFQTPKS